MKLEQTPPWRSQRSMKIPQAASQLQCRLEQLLTPEEQGPPGTRLWRCGVAPAPALATAANVSVTSYLA
jgi:hypothetical protein